MTSSPSSTSTSASKAVPHLPAAEDCLLTPEHGKATRERLDASQLMAETDPLALPQDAGEEDAAGRPIDGLHGRSRSPSGLGLPCAVRAADTTMLHVRLQPCEVLELSFAPQKGAQKTLNRRSSSMGVSPIELLHGHGAACADSRPLGTRRSAQRQPRQLILERSP